MRIALIADTFPPLRTSGAIQLRDLSKEFIRQGHFLTVLLPSPSQKEAWRLEETEGVQVLRLKAPHYKDISYIQRAFSELIMPFAMMHNLSRSPLAKERWDGIIWYSPSIFHGLLASHLKSANGCKGYLIIRDIFPQWAVDMGLIKKSLPYYFFDYISRYQYSVSDLIGVQTLSNLEYFQQWAERRGHRVEVLENWLGKPAKIPCSIRVAKTRLADRKILVFAGNMGVAQGLHIFILLAQKLLNRLDVGFLFVGRGSEMTGLKVSAELMRLDNVVFFDEIDPNEIPDLYAQCSIGIVALDPRHKIHNIPGKFITYMQSGLPTLANVNKGNDIIQIIKDNRVGEVCESGELYDLLQVTEKLLSNIEQDSDYALRCQSLFESKFTVQKAVNQIIVGLTSNGT